MMLTIESITIDTCSGGKFFPPLSSTYFIPCYARVLSLVRKTQMKWNAQWKIVFVGSLCICIFINKVTLVEQNNCHSFHDNNPRDPLPHPRWISRIHSTKIPKTWVGVWCRISGRLPHNVKMNKVEIYSDIKVIHQKKCLCNSLQHSW